MSSPSSVTLALQRWVDALNARIEPEVTRLAVSETARIDRCGFGAEEGQVVQVIEGRPGIDAWLALTRDVCRFELREVDAGGGRYEITAGDFTGGGRWDLTLDESGRIAWLRHQPDALVEQGQG